MSKNNKHVFFQNELTMNLLHSLFKLFLLQIDYIIFCVFIDVNLARPSHLIKIILSSKRVISMDVSLSLISYIAQLKTICWKREI